MVRLALRRRVRLRTIVGDGATVDGEVNASLEDGGAAGVAVDTDPSRCGVGAAAARARGGRWDSERARDGREGVLRYVYVSLCVTFLDEMCTYRGIRVVYGAGPVAAVLDVRDVGGGRRVRGDLEGLEGTRGAGAAGSDALREAGGDGKGGGSEEHGGQEGGGEHDGSETRACVGSSGW